MFTIPKKSFYYDEKKDCNVQYCSKERVRKAFSHILMCVFILMNANIFFACSENLHLNRIVLQYGFLSLPSALISNAFHFTICIYCMEIVFLLKAQCNSVRLLFLLSVFFQQRNVNFYISYLLVQG